MQISHMIMKWQCMPQTFHIGILMVIFGTMLLHKTTQVFLQKSVTWWLKQKSNSSTLAHSFFHTHFHTNIITPAPGRWLHE